MHEEGRGPVQAMEAALADAGIRYNDIDYISTHGTSTDENDSIETKAIKAVFKERAQKPPRQQRQKHDGAFNRRSRRSGDYNLRSGDSREILPPTINLNDPDPQLDLDYVPNKPRKAAVKIAMKESFGFGGQNNVVIIKRYEGK